MASSEQKPGFTVTDRRAFAGQAETEAPKESAAQPPKESAPPPTKAEKADDGRMPPVDFTTFVLSLGSSAVLHLGEAEHPRSGKVEKDLPMAKHTIDLLSMLQEKTKGNLTPQEAQILESLLYDLRLRYVEASKK
jgi:hypothetical protein